MITLDIRWPLGLIFTVVSIILLVYAAATNAENSVGNMLDAVWGAIMLVFGGCMLGLARRAARAGR